MQTKQTLITFLTAALAATILAAADAAQDESGFVSLFDGSTLKGWTVVGKAGPGYVPKDGVLVCPADGGGNLYTEKEYENFVFRFDFKLSQNANNGIGIRAPLEGDPAYLAMELQVLHDDGPAYKDKLRPEQYHGSIYDVVAAKRGSQKPPGEWNTEEIIADGRHIKVTVNGTVIIDTNLNDIKNPEKIRKHPGLFRERGHIGFLGHGTHIEFRNMRIKELPKTVKDNTAPEGFTALFNGKDLSGWKGLVADPPKRAKMSAEDLAAAQAKADQKMRDHWKPVDGVLVFDGKGDNLCTTKDYADFEMLVDWKIEPKGDSGIYLRGTPQVQIWEPNVGGPNPKKLGSGGLYNNQKNPSEPLKFADKPVGEWNTFRILMAGEKVHIFLNGVLVVNNTTLENYWERDKPIYPSGQLELQNHGNTLYFKNIYVREITPK
jgi:hypothetical protein